MISILLLIVFLFFFHIDKAKCIMLVAILYPTLTLFQVTLGLSVASILIVYSFVFMMNMTNSTQTLKLLPLSRPLVLSIATIFITFLLGSKTGWLAPISYTEQFLLIILLFYWYKPDVNTNEFVVKSYAVYIFLLSAYGLYESISINNPLLNTLGNYGVVANIQDESYVRFGMFRPQSLTTWTSTFGATSCFGCIILIYSLLNNYKRNYLLKLFTIVLSIVGVFLTGSRTIIAMFFIALLCFIPFVKNKKLILAVFILVLVVVNYLPNYANQVIEAFMDEDSVNGSTQSMREMQLAVALLAWSQHPVWGGGLGFVGTIISNNADLLGAESILYKLLIDRGIIGVLCYIFLNISAIVYLFKCNHSYLSFIVIAFVFAKYNSLLPSLDEPFVFISIIFIIGLIECPNKGRDYESTLV